MLTLLVVFVERTSGAPKIRFLAGAEVMVLDEERRLVTIGRSDADGSVRLAKRLVAPDRTPVILVCAPGCMCSAVRTDADQIQLHDEYVVAVAGKVVF